MNTKKNKSLIFFCIALIIIAVFSRLVNAEMHWYNFGPLVAISLFSGVVLKNKSLAFIIPLAAYFISDLALQLIFGNGFYGISQFFVYGGMILVVLLGSRMRQPKALKVLGYTIAGSLIFWLVSNLGVFIAGYYGYSFSGLLTTYLMAIPFYTHTGTEFFINQFVGDLIFSGILFGAYSLYRGISFQKAKTL